MNFIQKATLVVLGCAIAGGCGPGGPALGKVTGQVTLDGKPLPNVTVMFMPTGEGGSASGVTDASGNYSLTHANGNGAVVGKNKVAVTTLNAPTSTINPGQFPSDSPEYAKAMEAAQSGYNVKVTEPIPAMYNTDTKLLFDVKSGSQVINLELKSDGAAAAPPAAK